MPKLLQINVSANAGSTGKIAEQIGLMASKSGWKTWLAYGRGNNNSKLHTIRIGTNLDVNIHAIQTRLFDNHGLASKSATKRLISQIERIRPDLIHLHNIHGYYINYKILFEYLKWWSGPVVWTLHDCWSFTGHCAYFMLSGCNKWKTGCCKCGSLKEYPESKFKDRSSQNYETKKELFTSLGDNLILVPVSDFVGNYLNSSFFSQTRKKVIHNGIDLSVFKPSASKENIILGVANIWEERKGLIDFFKLRKILPDTYRIYLVGLNNKQLKNLPSGIEGVGRTSSQHELAKLYSSAIALVNPTYEDNYPTVNLEAIACGTPVITYRTGGSPESITNDTGIVLKPGDISGINEAIIKIVDGDNLSEACRQYAECHFDQRKCFKEYIDLYNNILNL